MKIIAVLSTTLLVLLSAAAVAEEDPILQRQELMEGMKDNGLKPMVGMARGEAEFDAATVAAGIEIMQDVAANVGDLFPEGSDTGHDTEALPAIWTDRAGFDKALENFTAATDRAAAAPPQSVDELKAMLDDLLKTCKGCHDDYRVEHEDH